jgi:hypothetical protein
MAAEKSEKTSWFLGEANSGWEPDQNGGRMSDMNMRGRRLQEHTTPRIFPAAQLQRMKPPTLITLFP